MALDNPTFISGLQASGDLSSDRYKLVKRSGTANQVAVCTAVTDLPIGVLYNAPGAAGKGADVAGFAGGSRIKVKVGAAGVAAGAEVATDANGLLVATTTSGHYAIGTVDAAWDSGDYAEVISNFHELA